MRLTPKLLSAAEQLADERFGDCHPLAIINAVARGEVRRSEVYRTLGRYGYCWNGVYWTRKRPAWLRNLAGMEE